MFRSLSLSSQIRGAPAIASLAALGIAAELLALLNNRPSPSFPAETLSSPTSTLLGALLDRTAYLLTSRPTAVNLREALTRIEGAAREEAARQGATAESLAKKVVDVAVGVWVEDKERCERIGNNGARWILEKLEREGTIEKGEKISVLTVRPPLTFTRQGLDRVNADPLSNALQVCNTGSLATSVSTLLLLLRLSFGQSLTASPTGLRHRYRRHHLAPPPRTPRARLLRSDRAVPAGRAPHGRRDGEPGCTQHDGLRHGHWRTPRREEGASLCRRR